MAVSDCSRQCRRCGKDFFRTAKGQPTKYCSTWCRDGGRPKVVRRPKENKECPGCGTVFLGHARRKYCSRQCKASHVVVMSGRQSFQCEHCGKQADRNLRTKDARRFCGRGCYWAYTREVRPLVSAERDALYRIASNWKWKPSPLVAKEVAALRKIARYVERPRLKRRPCLDCGVQVVCVKDSGKLCRTCSKRHTKERPSFKAARRVNKARRRAAERGVHADRIDPIKVFDRDGWRCHLCGCKTPKELRGTYQARAPELDHVIPLAIGGTHTWGNVKCSCRACNGAKGATAAGQLGLDIAA